MNVRLIIPYDSIGDCLRLYDKAIADIAGGFTSWQGTGGWKDYNGNLIVEPITVVDCHYENSGKVDIVIVECFRNLAKRIAQDLRQECVYLAIDGKAEYIRP